MSDLLIDTTSDDIYVSPAGQARLTETVEEDAQQRLKLKLSRFVGEWFLAPQLGVPFLRRVFVKNPNIPVIQSLIAAQIVGDPAVDSLKSLSLDWDRAERVLRVSFEAILVNGEVLAVEDGIRVLSIGGATLTGPGGLQIRP